jgi:hypothetical protein
MVAKQFITLWNEIWNNEREKSLAAVLYWLPLNPVTLSQIISQHSLTEVQCLSPNYHTRWVCFIQRKPTLRLTSILGSFQVYGLSHLVGILFYAFSANLSQVMFFPAVFKYSYVWGYVWGILPIQSWWTK